MIKRSVREILFFVLMGLLFYLFVKLANLWKDKAQVGKLAEDGIYFVVGVVFSLLMAGIFLFSNLDRSSENFWDVSPAAQCKGGNWYNWQGDSDEAKMCRDLASSDEGRCAIASYSCPTGFIGTPKIPYYYSPLSDDNWQNQRCMNMPECGCEKCAEAGMQAFERQVPFDT